MKTFDEILIEVIDDDFRYENITKKSPESRAAKEYAKQWVTQVVKEISDSPHGNDSMITYYNLAIDAQ